MRWRTCLFGAFLALAGHSMAVAALVDWTMNGTFADGGTLNGSFTFDANTHTATNWNLSVAGGNTATFPPFTYDPLDTVFQSGGTVGGHFILQFRTPAFDRFVFFAFNPDLTNAGGTTNVFVSPGNSSELVIAGTVGTSRDFTSGSATGTAETPEPATLALVSLGFLATGLRLRRVRKERSR